MRAILFAGLASAVLLGGCAVDGQAGNGASVRALMASQAMPARPHEEGGADGAAAAAAYANYKRSYVSPQPQGDSTLVGARK
jgi:hypothetical protein